MAQKPRAGRHRGESAGGLKTAVRLSPVAEDRRAIVRAAEAFAAFSQACLHLLDTE